MPTELNFPLAATSIILDPTEHFTEVGDFKLIQALGLLPKFIIDHEDSEGLPPLGLQAIMDKAYRFGLYPLGNQASVNDAKALTYPGDPDLYPLALITRGRESLAIYQHALVAFFDEEGKTTLITRMD